jgi:DNA-binding winged helix-turn-helix (wHTH) protein/tetratricopeptide (TPR) repeat protein
VIGNIFLLDGWLVDISGGQISRNEVKERLEPQVMKVLSYLSAHPNAVVTREELFDNLWDHSFVGDAALTRCIFEIRRAFRDDPKKPRIVETIPRVGFRLVAIPAVLPRQAPAVRRMTPWAAVAALVMSFIVVQAGSSGDDTQLRVHKPTLAIQTYGKALAHHKIISRASNRNAIVMFERAVEQDTELGPAYAGLAEALSRQIMYWGGERIADAEAAAESAIRLSPGHPRSHNALGLARHLSGDDDMALESFARARSMDPAYVDPIYNSAELYRRRLELKRAAELFRTVIELDPGNTYAMTQLGFLNLRMGNIDTAQMWIQRVIDDAPFERFANSQLATMEMVKGNFANAIEVCETLYDLYPVNRACLNILGNSNLAIGNHDEAMRWFRVLEDAFEGKDYALLGQAQVMIASGEHGQGLILVDDVLQRALAAVDTPNADWNTYWTIAACLALKGDANNAFVWLDKAADAGRRFHLWDNRDTVFSALHGDHRFEHYIATTKSSSNTL